MTNSVFCYVLFFLDSLYSFPCPENIYVFLLCKLGRAENMYLLLLLYQAHLFSKSWKSGTRSSEGKNGKL